jgi:hypothetical protein
MRSMLGKNVRVVLDKPEGRDPVVTQGILLSYNDGGDIAIKHEDGFTTYAWPALECEVVE